jgi:hypothetical protein
MIIETKIENGLALQNELMNWKKNLYPFTKDDDLISLKLLGSRKINK